MKKSNVVKLLSVSLLGTTMLGVSVKADIQTDTINEMWGKPTLVYGSGLSDSEVVQTNNAFNIKNIDNVNRQVNSGADFAKYLNIEGVSDSELFSSVLVQKANKGVGVKVKIKTPENITSITQTQYENAAITAGASNVEIEVASIKKVTGESALVGVYKALDANGQKVDTKRAEVASQELSTVNSIAGESALNKEQSAQLDNALAQIKSDLTKYKEENASKATADVVRDTVKKAVKDNGLSKYISDEQVESLVSLADAYQNTAAIDDKEVQKQLSALQNKMAEAYGSIKDTLNSDEAKGIFDTIGDWLNSLWNSLTSWF